MPASETILATLREQRKVLGRRYPIQRLALFGSWARGDAREDSDDRLSMDLREAYPDMQGFSPRNLLFMRSFAEAWPDAEKVKQLVSQLPWGHVIRLLQRLRVRRQAGSARL